MFFTNGPPTSSRCIQSQFHHIQSAFITLDEFALPLSKSICFSPTCEKYMHPDINNVFAKCFPRADFVVPTLYIWKIFTFYI